MAGLRVEWLKWPAEPYRVTPMTLLGRDEFGSWLFAPEGTAASYTKTGDAPLPVNFLTLVPDGGRWWIATWMWGNPAINIDVYVDIVHPPTWESDSCLRVVDLDLDVILLRDGSLLLDDEEEFAEHSLSLSYPDSVIAAARAAAEQMLADIAVGAPPFGGEAQRWLDVRPTTPPAPAEGDAAP